MENDRKRDTSLVIKESDIKGEKIIFDILIKETLAHVIVIKDGQQYHLNLDGEDFGSFCRDDNGDIQRFEQPKGAHRDDENYFKPILEKLEQLNK
ncbi:hypothetical protein [Pedobacter boryungensis]|uniref:Uncharacterized protein n=1 Tax=Pedobacter boryungensis TaxID=869962 RepID=A0ABX2D8Y9_9SPHI|nr:hypothetical protein [Pedobacter boryungensis]NQX30494.1 hypothetical protein [Pedobacter boryungensis]